MGAINGRVIYSPKGKAGEYAENAANFFVGCSNGCAYCYLQQRSWRKGIGRQSPGVEKDVAGISIRFGYFQKRIVGA